MDHPDLQHLLNATHERLEAQVEPLRRRFERLGPAGCYALAAEHAMASTLSVDPDEVRHHEAAAVAAQRLGDALATARAGKDPR